MPREYTISTSRQPARQCPSCHTVHDAATGIGVGRQASPVLPTTGDITCCSRCGAVLVFLERGFRVATDEEFSALPRELRRVLLRYITEHTTRRRSVS